MKLRTAVLAVLLATAPVMAQGAVVDPAEPPATPAGGAPQAGIGVAGAVGIAVGIAVIVAIAGDDDDAVTATATATATGTGTQ
jgi:hypothetical protein